MVLFIATALQFIASRTCRLCVWQHCFCRFSFIAGWPAEGEQKCRFYRIALKKCSFVTKSGSFICACKIFFVPLYAYWEFVIILSVCAQAESVTLRYWSANYKNIFVSEPIPFTNDTQLGTVAQPFVPTLVVGQ